MEINITELPDFLPDNTPFVEYMQAMLKTQEETPFIQIKPYN